jgi:hypothetical protein
MLSTLRAITHAMLGKVPGRRGRLDTATRVAMDADFSGRGEPASQEREPAQKIDPIDELMRIVGAAERETRRTAPNAQKFADRLRRPQGRR